MTASPDMRHEATRQAGEHTNCNTGTSPVTRSTAQAAAQDLTMRRLCGAHTARYTANAHTCSLTLGRDNMKLPKCSFATRESGRRQEKKDTNRPVARGARENGTRRTYTHILIRAETTRSRDEEDEGSRAVSRRQVQFLRMNLLYIQLHVSYHEVGQDHKRSRQNRVTVPVCCGLLLVLPDTEQK